MAVNVTDKLYQPRSMTMARARIFSREARAGQLLVRTNKHLSENGSGACNACVHNYTLLHTRSYILCFRSQRSVRSLNDTPRGGRIPPA